MIELYFMGSNRFSFDSTIYIFQFGTLYSSTGEMYDYTDWNAETPNTEYT